MTELSAYDRLMREALPTGTFGGSRTLTPPRARGYDTGPKRQCAQCGRTGTRQFTEIAATEYTAAITVCANRDACRRRWPKPVDS